MNLKINASQKLKVIFVATVLGAAAIEGTVFAHQHHAPTGKDAFLHYQVDSTDELITALKNNPTLRRNYAHHFGIPEDQVLDFVKRTLVPYHLPAARNVTTYGVTKTGHIYPVTTHLKKGTLVWATRSGLPVLKWACANPLTKNLPGTLLSAGPKPTMGRRIAQRTPLLASVPSAELPEAPMTTPAIAIAAPTLSGPLLTTSSALTLPPVIFPVVATTVPVMASLPVHMGGGHGTSALPLIPILIGTLIAGNNSGGGGNGSTGGPVPTGTIPTGSTGFVSPPTLPGSGGTPTPEVPGTPIALPTPTVPVLTPTPTPYIPTATPTPTPQTGPTPAPVVPNIPPGTPNVVPEPGSLSLLALAGLPAIGGFLARRRRAA